MAFLENTVLDKCMCMDLEACINLLTVPCLGCTDDDDTCYVIINNVTMNDYAFENGSLILPGSVQGVYGTVCCGRSVIEAEQTCYRICPPQNGKLY